MSYKSIDDFARMSRIISRMLSSYSESLASITWLPTYTDALADIANMAKYATPIVAVPNLAGYADSISAVSDKLLAGYRESLANVSRLADYSVSVGDVIELANYTAPISEMADRLLASYADQVSEIARSMLSSQVLWQSPVIDTARVLAALSTERASFVATAEVEVLTGELTADNEPVVPDASGSELAQLLAVSVSRVVTAAAAAGAAVDSGTRALIAVILLLALIVGWQQALILTIALFGQDIRDHANKGAGKNQDDIRSDG